MLTEKDKDKLLLDHIEETMNGLQLRLQGIAYDMGWNVQSMKSTKNKLVVLRKEEKALKVEKKDKEAKFKFWHDWHEEVQKRIKNE